MIKKLLLLGLMFLLCSSCLRRALVPETEPVTILTVTSTKSTNNGLPLYVVLKFTDFPNFLIDDYQMIANLTSTFDPDPSFMSICLIPGTTVKRMVKPPPDQSVGVYCLFTDCGEAWKHLIDTECCQEVTIVLGEHEISSVELR